MNTPAFLPAGQCARTAPVITRATGRGVALPGQAAMPAAFGLGAACTA